MNGGTVDGHQEFPQCPECKGTSIDILKQWNRTPVHQDQRRCRCNDCGYAGKWWNFKQFRKVAIIVETTQW